MAKKNVNQYFDKSGEGSAVWEPHPPGFWVQRAAAIRETAYQGCVYQYEHGKIDNYLLHRLALLRLELNVVCPEAACSDGPFPANAGCSAEWRRIQDETIATHLVDCRCLNRDCRHRWYSGSLDFKCPVCGGKKVVKTDSTEDIDQVRPRVPVPDDADTNSS